MKKNIKDSIINDLIITAPTTAILFGLKITNVKPLKLYLDATDIMKCADGTCGGVLVKDFVVYKKLINE